MTETVALKTVLLARRRELIGRLAAGVDVTGFADGGLVCLLASTQTAIEALRADEAEKSAR
jgi:hypothetical protein